MRQNIYISRLFIMLIMVIQLSLVQAATDCNQVTEIPVTECQALLDFYSYTGGLNWGNNSGWNETNTPCSWRGVICDGGWVTGLNLPHHGLSGSIPESLGQLSQLTTLTLSGNELSGSIPESLGQLSQLTVLSLYDNDLSGSIPESLEQLSQLTVLSLSANDLSGSIPESLEQLSQLTQLDLSANDLSGSIPESLGQLSQLTRLDLSYNQLCGEIPYSLTNLPLRYGFFTSNHLTASAPIVVQFLSNPGIYWQPQKPPLETCEYIPSWFPPSEDCVYARNLVKNTNDILNYCKAIYGPHWKDIRDNCSNERVNFHACVALTKDVCPHSEITLDSEGYNDCPGAN